MSYVAFIRSSLYFANYVKDSCGNLSFQVPYYYFSDVSASFMDWYPKQLELG